MTRTRVRRLAGAARGAGKVAVVVVVTLAVPVAVAAPAVTGARADFYTEPPGPLPDPAPAPPRPHDPTRPTAVVLLGNEGTNAADALPPYEVLAASGAFNVYTVAAERRLVPLVGGLDLVPDFGYAGLRRLLDSPPDVIVVPQIEDEPRPGSPVVGWLEEQRAAGSPLIVSVCVGAEILAEAGYLTHRPATSHWLGLIGLRRSHPEVDWVDDVRYVDDGDVVTSAGVLSGIDGTLRAVERFAGPQVAARAPDEVGWPFYRPGRPAPLEPPHLAPADSVALLSAAYRWDRQQLGVRLTDGVSETGLAAAFRGYTELNFLAGPLAFSEDGRPVRSRFGLTFVPRADAAEAARKVDRVIVPDTGPGFAFDATLRDIADHYDTATARWVAKSLQYPTDGLRLQGVGWPWGLTLRFTLLAAAGLALAVTAIRLPALVRRRKG